MVKIIKYLQLHRPVAVLMGVILILTAIPVLDLYLVVGNTWQGIPPMFGDETFYLARVHAVGAGYLNGGHPYFLEHLNDPPLVIFGGVWINALPLLAGFSLNMAIIFNFVLWSLIFAAVLYWLFREFRVSPWISAFSTVFLYIESYSHVWRPVNLQTVYPFYFLFYLALMRLIRDQSRKNIILLAFSIGATFYLFAYLWQIALITMGLLFLYAFFKQNQSLLKAAFLSSFIGGIIGLPVPLYALWLSRSSPYFWESIGRLGLVNTHLPMAEVVYSGGWIGVLLALLVVLYWRIPALRENKEFILLCLFVGVSGLGIWIMQGSNIITGKLLETGEHIRRLIIPWLIFSTISSGVLLWKRRALLSRGLRSFSVITLTVLSGVILQYTYAYFSPFLPQNVNREAWLAQQLYAKPFAWLQNEEKSSVVVWSDPRDPSLSSMLPVFTRHFTLYTWPGLMELAPESEIRERYLVSQYFNDPTVADLKDPNNMGLYLGRRDIPHQAKTIERGIKICRILFFWDKNKDCGMPPTSQELLGDKFFEDLENKFQTDIKPNIKTYLKKYHVSYILKDKVLNPTYRTEVLGAKLVYSDDRYEIYHLP